MHEGVRLARTRGRAAWASCETLAALAATRASHGRERPAEIGRPRLEIACGFRDGLGAFDLDERRFFELDRESVQPAHDAIDTLERFVDLSRPGNALLDRLVAARHLVDRHTTSPHELWGRTRARFRRLSSRRSYGC